MFAASPVAASNDLADTARFLAGKPLSPDSPLADHARTDAYTQYAADITAGWKQFEAPNLDQMRAWWAARATSATVFYPFSGPDIGNALALFPDAETYLLFGLEPPGSVPDLASMDDATIATGLTELSASLGTLFQVNYFFTRAMEKKLGPGSFNSVTGLLLFSLATSDCEVTTARRIAIGPDGALASSSRSGIPGVEITFRRSGRKQTIRYFMVDVADASKSSATFFAYVKKAGRLATMIKSASYLMHKDGVEEPAHFAQIRSLILAQSDFVVQDDSGIPLRLFKRDTWNVRFHGRYDAPTPEFGKFLQKDLRVETQRNSSGKLPFSYGYAYKPGESNLMTAERAR